MVVKSQDSKLKDETWSAIASGLAGLVEVQGVVSGRVPGALTGSREDVVQYAYALIEEVIETTREIHTKPWKSPEPPNVDRVIEEWADVLAFVGIMTHQLALACGIDPLDFAQIVAYQYAQTSRRNLARFEAGREPAGIQVPESGV